MRTLNERRAPASFAVKRTRTVADSPVGRQRHVLRAHDPPVVFDVERHGLPAYPVCDMHDVDGQRRALQRRRAAFRRA